MAEHQSRGGQTQGADPRSNPVHRQRGKAEEPGQPERAGPRPTDATQSTNLHQQPTRRATGPRTLQGKRRSKYNAVTHGIFADAVLEGRESTAEFKKLVHLLRQDYKPQRHIEEILVGKLATIVWQQRRLLQAEKKELSRSSVFEELEQTDAWEAEAFAWARSEEAASLGAIQKRGNLLVLNYCLWNLRIFRGALKERGFKADVDRSILQLVYGKAASLCYPIVLAYEIDQLDGSVSPAEGHGTGAEQSQAGLSHFLEVLDSEIRDLESELKQRTLVGESRPRFERSRLLPRKEVADLLLRYQGSLDRRFDRSLSQLETLRRMREQE